ncbi:MAG: 30S ribosome-binding factor RbfA [Planctomycetota bacterium]
MASPRTIAKLEARIHERVAHCIEFEIADPRGGMITLTGVKLSTDLSIAHVRYTVFGGTSERSKAEHMLESAAGFIQRQVGRVLSMRRTPALRFHYDESLEEARRLDELIHEALERDQEIHQSGHAPPISGELATDPTLAADADDSGDEDEA